jgi:hypothetical protein
LLHLDKVSLLHLILCIVQATYASAAFLIEPSPPPLHFFMLQLPRNSLIVLKSPQNLQFCLILNLGYSLPLSLPLSRPLCLLCLGPLGHCTSLYPLNTSVLVCFVVSFCLLWLWLCLAQMIVAEDIGRQFLTYGERYWKSIMHPYSQSTILW